MEWDSQSYGTTVFFGVLGKEKMTEETDKGTQASDTVELLQGAIVDYLEKMDAATVGRATIFRTSRSKTDLETKVWHCYHKVQASAYHMQQINRRVDEVRSELRRLSGSSLTESPLAITEFKISVRNRTILYDVDAFFAASRSAIDFLGSCLSRYIQGKDTDRFKKIVEFLRGSEDALARLVISPNPPKEGVGLAP